MKQAFISAKMVNFFADSESVILDFCSGLIVIFSGYL